MESPLCPPTEPEFRLIETFGFVPGQGIERWPLHLARLQASAACFSIPFDRNEAELQVAALADRAERLRCRLTLSVDGVLELTTAPMPAKAGVWRFAIAAERLSSDDPFLAHKTTRRALYDQQRAAMPAGIDEVIFLNERGEVCEGTITNLSLTTQDGQRLTPALSSGCLSGVYRQSRLNKGLLQEAVLTLDDLANARSINLMNSLRGSTQAIWAPECAEFVRFA